MNSLDNWLGELCKVLLPIPEEYYFGNKNSKIAVCTLSSIDLLKQISKSSTFQDLAIVGRLLSENKGIEKLVRFVNKNKIESLILCGRDVWGHRAGHSLLALYENGINNSGRIIYSSSPDPFVNISKKEVIQFQNQVQIIDKIGETNFSTIKRLVDSLKY